MSKLIPIILSGGAGKRLWPISRQTRPKPFMQVGGKPLLQHALERAALVSDSALIVTQDAHYYASKDLVAGLDMSLDVSYLLEPSGRNTAPAIAQAVRHLSAHYGDETLGLLLAADHLIDNADAFCQAVESAAAQAREGALAVFGIQPTAPDIGYGYIEVASKSDTPQPATRFVEKPDAETAMRFLADGRYYWNSGMLCFSCRAMEAALARHAPDIWRISATVPTKSEGAVTRLQAVGYDTHPDISLDFAVLERADNVALVPARFGWSDVGSWDAVAQAHPTNADGNSIAGIDARLTALHDTRNTHIEQVSHVEKYVAMLGVEDLVVVDTPDALLVAHRDHTQTLRAVVETLPASVTELPATVHRPWGSYATLKTEQGYQVKRITVAPDQQLSLQYHHKRAEHWVVTQGRALVQIGDETFETAAGDYRYIPLGEKHRLTNIGTEELVLIEVQCGDYLGEDDIVRLADDYGRVAKDDTK